jgi:hypothetical protein
VEDWSVGVVVDLWAVVVDLWAAEEDWWVSVGTVVEWVEGYMVDLLLLAKLCMLERVAAE